MAVYSYKHGMYTPDINNDDHVRVRMQVHNKIPDDAWEYQIRKALNDAAYNGLDYVPYCSTMPVQEKCDNPQFMWKKKGGK